MNSLKVPFLAITLFLVGHYAVAQNDFGTIIYYKVVGKKASVELLANNIRVITINGISIVRHKIYSEGTLLITGMSMFGFTDNLNLTIKNNDTIYVKVDSKLENVPKKQYLFQTKYLSPTVFDIQENINFPYNPIFAKKIFKGQERTGTGFLLSKDGYIVTNCHVIDKANLITVKGVNGNPKSSLSASVVLKDEKNDLAIIKLDDRILLDEVPFVFKPTQSTLGERIFVLGYPLTSSMGEDIKMTDGSISSKNGFEGNINSYQISAPVQPGNSGGPVFDETGCLVGVVNAKHSVAENATYAIKVKYLQELNESMDKPMVLSTKNMLTNLTMPQKIDALQKFVYIIEVK